MCVTTIEGINYFSLLLIFKYLDLKSKYTKVEYGIVVGSFTMFWKLILFILFSQQCDKMKDRSRESDKYYKNNMFAHMLYLWLWGVLFIKSSGNVWDSC